MIKIAICDDEKIFLKKLECVISNYMKEKKLSYEIDLFDAGIDFVQLGAGMAKYQILF